MSAELIAVIAAAVTLGGLITLQIAGVRAAIGGLDARLRAVETELAYLRGLIAGRGFAPPAPPTTDEGNAA